jgi:phospholipid-binding lipoprotein MlaA
MKLEASRLMFIVFGFLLGFGTLSSAQSSAPNAGKADAGATEDEEDSLYDPFAKPEAAGKAKPAIRDPLEKVNRAMFKVNDKLYFWVLKPVATGYRKVVPEPARVSVRRFFTNASSGVRIANCALQGKLKETGTESARFVINTTVGLAGLFDPAESQFHLQMQEEDLGQTLGRYRIGQGFYVIWPIVGPASVRDTVGMVGDGFLLPWPYFLGRWPVLGVRAYDKTNGTSLVLGEYESFKASALDPYVSLRNAYAQYRESKVKE